ncbi:MAG: DUF5678 domain-containing protein [bacterium]
MKDEIFSKQELEDFDWLLDHYPGWVSKYPDKWVAVHRKSLVAVGDDAEEVGREARKKFGESCRPVVMFVEGGAYVYQNPA